MPTARFKLDKLREYRIIDEASLWRAFGQQLIERGFIEGPLTVERTGESREDYMVITQEDLPGRLPNKDPRVYPLLQRMAHTDATAIGELQGLLFSESDDRADVLAQITADMPAFQDALFDVYDDWETQRDGNSDVVVKGEVIVERKLCKKALVLMGARDEEMV